MPKAGRALSRASLLVLVLVSSVAREARAGDSGLLLSVNRGGTTLTARDLEHGVAGPSLPILVGSTEHPTPRGAFALRTVIRNPRYTPGREARARGAEPVSPSSDGPLGVAKLPFGGGATALHGGSVRLAFGRSNTLGCVGTLDADLLALLDWMRERRALAPEVPQPDGEVHQRIRRPTHLLVE